ncbi:MAG TPA: BON domain-containing protein [Gemmatimonadales bacterium]
MPRDERRSGSRPTRRRERVIREDPGRAQPLEEGQGPAGPAGSFAGSPADFMTPNRYGGPLRRRDDPPNPRNQGTGGEGGFSTIGGDTYYGEGSDHDAPDYGDWGRRATGAGPGREGLVHEGEHTWGESRQQREREQTTGGHAGRGPRTSRRSDGSLHEEIREMLTHHPEIDAGDVEVLVEDGEVTLQGAVNDRDMRWLVEDLVESVSGVSLVHNRLRVARR